MRDRLIINLHFGERQCTDMAFVEIPIPASSNVKSVHFDADTQTLRVTFQSGGVYDYAGVDENKANGFSTAESAGRYLDSNIKRQHTYSRLA